MQRFLITYNMRLVQAVPCTSNRTLLQRNVHRRSNLRRLLSSMTNSSTLSTSNDTLLSSSSSEPSSLSTTLDIIDRKEESMAIFNRLKETLLFGNFQSRNILRIAADNVTFAVSNTDEIRQYTSSSSSSSSSQGYDNITPDFEATPPSPEDVLMQRQLKLEEDVCHEAIRSYAEVLDNLFKMGKGAYMTRVQRMILSWYEPFVRRLEVEIKSIGEKEKGKARKDYGPILLMLPVEKLAIITSHAVVNAILKRRDEGVRVYELALHIGELIEAEVSVGRIRRSKDPYMPPAAGEVNVSYDIDDMKVPQEGRYTAKNISKYRQTTMKLIDNIFAGRQNVNVSTFMNLKRSVKKLLEEENWPNSLKLKTGAALISMLMETAKRDDNSPAFVHSVSWEMKGKGILPPGKNRPKISVGVIKLDDDLLELLAESQSALEATQNLRYMPMLVPPREWACPTTRGVSFHENSISNSAYYSTKSTLMRTHSKDQQALLRHATIPEVVKALNYLGCIPWRINSSMLENIKTMFQKGIEVAELPPHHNLTMPFKEHCYKKMKMTIDGRISEYESEFYDSSYYKEVCRRVIAKNMEFHSLRCDMYLKLWIGEKFKNEKIYYPHNMDFRGRAYPIPPNLNHIGSDLCRGLLLFDEAKPLGPDGLGWMKVHLANLHGQNKISFKERIAWVDENMDKVIYSATHPMDNKGWWTLADEPFQALNTCIEIVKAIESGNPESFMSRLPVHVDGSCNGLQHYAALGLDVEGAIAVNLLDATEPQDVYSAVLTIVLKKIENDLMISDDETDEVLLKKKQMASFVKGIVDRKVVKQTVMTSVYGVTRLGARQQVLNKLEEKIHSDPNKVITPDLDKEIFRASKYVSDLTLDSIGEMFQGAKGIMDWLGDCATIVASQGQAMSWMTPLGLPVSQPYRKYRPHTVRTIMQTITLSSHDESLPINGPKQKSAFAPNFVHSLDATHMLMTANKMKERGLVFSAVHDSYWTHACDIPVLGEVLRESFTEMYDRPILEDLLDSLKMRYPECNFPPVPRRGVLDLSVVKNATYFFH